MNNELKMEDLEFHRNLRFHPKRSFLSLSKTGLDAFHVGILTGYDPNIDLDKYRFVDYEYIYEGKMYNGQLIPRINNVVYQNIDTFEMLKFNLTTNQWETNKGGTEVDENSIQ